MNDIYNTIIYNNNYNNARDNNKNVKHIDKRIKIAVMDSGAGGLSVLKILLDKFPFGIDFLYICDLENMPYGNKSENDIKNYCKKDIKIACDSGADMIVVACNTMSTVGEKVFEKYAKMPTFFVRPDLEKAVVLGLENCLLFCTAKTAVSPAISRLSNSCSGFVLPLKYLAEDIENMAEKLENCVFACDKYNLSDLRLIDNKNKDFLNCKGNYDGKIFSMETEGKKATLNGMKNYDNAIFSQGTGGKSLLDKKYIFLGCTHYLLIRDKFQKIFKNAIIFDGCENFLTKLEILLSKVTILETKSSKSFMGSGNLEIEHKFNKIFGEI